MTPSTKTKLLHFLALLGSVATAVAPAWVDPQQTWTGRIAITIVVGLLLGVGTEQMKSQKNAILAGLALAGVVVAAIYGRFTAGTAGFAAVGGLLAVISQVRTILAKELADPVLREGQPAPIQSEQPKGSDMPKIASIIVLVAALGASLSARADINLDEIAPKLTRCWGTTCVMPDAAVNATLFDISAKKWTVGTTSLGAGMALLFASDQAIASGLTVHLTGVLSQEEGKPSFYMPTVGVILARYCEIGYSRAFTTGGPDRSYISVAGNIPWDVFTVATMPTRVAAARAGKRLTEGDF